MEDHQKTYIASHKAWLKSNELNQIEIQTEIDGGSALINAISQKNIALYDHLKLSREMNQHGAESFLMWCNDNHIDPTTV